MSSSSSSSHPMSFQEERANAIYSGIGLAPMVRASTTPLRTLAAEYGAKFCYSEELVDRALLETIRCENTQLKTIDYIKDPSNLSPKVKRRMAKKKQQPALLLRIASHERNFILQLGTASPELALKAAQHVQQDVDAIDINMGCPKTFSTSGGMGAVLLSDPDRAASIVSTLVQNLQKPISVKIRLLQDVQTTVQFCERLIQAGVHAIAIHGRTIHDDSIYPAKWDQLQQVVQTLKQQYPRLPVLVNGDFYTRTEQEQFLRESGANGILLARPALYNTSIFADKDVDKTTVIQHYLQQAVRYNAHYKNVKYVICEMMTNRRAPTHRVPQLPQVYAGQQTIGQMCQCQSLEQICQLWKVSYNPNETPPSLPGDSVYCDSYFQPPAKKPKLVESENTTADQEATTTNSETTTTAVPNIATESTAT